MIPKLEEYKERWGVESEQSIHPGLDAIRDALTLLDNPEKKINAIHIAGTNGKGSTIAFLEQIALHHGLTVGKFMSPSIVDVHDQIQINGNPITQKELDAVFVQLKKAGLSGKLTDFELLTCAAFLTFAQRKLDIVLIETGMGGRYDSTNVVLPLVSIIPSISLDHTNFLGTTLAEVANHKAGIIKDDVPIIIGKLPPEAYYVVKKEAMEKKSSLFAIEENFHIDFTNEGDRFTIHDFQLDGLVRALPGKHQGENMALAIRAFLEISTKLQVHVEKEKVRNAVKEAKLSGRFEQVLPNVYFDGAHNQASAEKLVETIRTIFPKKKIRFVIGMLADKDVETVLNLLESISDEFYFVDFNNSRAMTAQKLMAISNAPKKQVLKDYLSFLKSSASNEEITMVTGSLYLLAELRRQFQ